MISFQMHLMQFYNSFFTLVLFFFNQFPSYLAKSFVMLKMQTFFQQPTSEQSSIVLLQPLIFINFLFFSFFKENCKKLQPTYVQSCKDNCSRGRELKHSKPYTGIVNIPLYLTWYSGDRLGGFQIIAGFHIRDSGLTSLLGLPSPDIMLCFGD